jgi:hypothetical protein
MSDLNRYDFFSCPTLIPAHEVMAAFERGADQSAFDLSIDRYRNAIGWGVRFDLSIGALSTRSDRGQSCARLDAATGRGRTRCNAGIPDHARGY